jgi:TIR domain
VILRNSADNANWDLFISHAWEDRYEIAQPLAERLKHKELRVWYDDFVIKPGDSITESIGRGLKNSRFGLIILSKNFFKKNWTAHEYQTLLKKAVDSGKRILIPVWHNVGLEEVRSYSEELADIKALQSNIGLEELSNQLVCLVRYSSVAEPSPRSIAATKVDDFLYSTTDDMAN